MRGINKLTALKINSLKAPGKYADGLGLYLLIRRPGDKSWCFRYMRNGHARQLGLGPLHSVSLQEARNRAREARQLILDGRDPIEVRHQALQAHKAEQLRTLTFREAALQFLATDKVQKFKSDKHRKQWGSTLESYAFPVFGDLPLQSIDTAIVLRALLPVWKRTPETGSRLRGRIERVFAWAKPLKLIDGENPASREVLKDHLPTKAKAKHHEAMPYADLPAFMERLRDRDSMSARCLEFTILTAARTQEAIGARWSEIDLDAGVWTIPAARMKAKRDHRVPLSHRVVEMLRGLTKKSGGLIFPLSNMAMLNLIKGMEGNGYTVHGFRSAFSDWARDRTGYARDVIEMALAHTIKDKSEAAYRRGDALDKRRRLMNEWARYCQSPAVSADVVALHG
jgi:integrase